MEPSTLAFPRGERERGNVHPRKRSALRKKGLIHGAIVIPKRVSVVVFPEHNGRRGDSLTCQARMYLVCSVPLVGFPPSPFQAPLLSQQVPKWAGDQDTSRRRKAQEPGRWGQAAPSPFRGHSYLHKQLTSTHANPGRDRLDNELDNEAIHCCRERSEQHFTLSARINSIFLHYTAQQWGVSYVTFAERVYSWFSANGDHSGIRSASFTKGLLRAPRLTPGCGNMRRKQKLLSRPLWSYSVELCYLLW